MSNLGLAITSLFSGVSAETKSRRKSSAAAFPAKASAVLEAVVGSMMTALGCGENMPDGRPRIYRRWANSSTPFTADPST